jgi:hypothetical protein
MLSRVVSEWGSSQHDDWFNVRGIIKAVEALDLWSSHTFPRPNPTASQEEADTTAPRKNTLALSIALTSRQIVPGASDYVANSSSAAPAALEEILRYHKTTSIPGQLNIYLHRVFNSRRTIIHHGICSLSHTPFASLLFPSLIQAIDRATPRFTSDRSSLALGNVIPPGSPTFSQLSSYSDALLTRAITN